MNQRVKYKICDWNLVEIYNVGGTQRTNFRNCLKGNGDPNHVFPETNPKRSETGDGHRDRRRVVKGNSRQDIRILEGTRNVCVERYEYTPEGSTTRRTKLVTENRILKKRPYKKLESPQIGDLICKKTHVPGKGRRRWV